MSTTPLAAPVLPYPLATKSQEVIPHEVAAPAGCYRIPVVAGGAFEITDLPSIPLVAIHTNTPVLAVFSDDFQLSDLASTSLLGGALFCAPGVTISYLPAGKPLHLVNEGDADTIVYVQLLNTWNVLGVDQQLKSI